MKNRKGFTLVELLAVIAILAILIIIALPNVMKMYVKAKKNTFLTEVQNVLKESSNKFIQEGMSGNKVSVVSNSKNPLNLIGEKLEYKVKLDNKGNVTDYIISNGNYCVTSKKSFDNLTVDDVKENCSYEDLNNIAGTLDKNYYKIAFGADSNKSLVNSITFYSDGRKLESNATNGTPVDVSEKKDNSVLLYANYISGSSSIMDLYIIANGKIMFPKDSSNLLAFYSQVMCSSSSSLTGIYLNDAVDTSKVTNMSNMFAQAAPIAVYCASHRWGCGYTVNKINSLDLSNFDTSNVTDMSYMFMGNQSPDINLSGFDTSNVVDMSYMFWGASSLTGLNLNSFNTSNVTNMGGMFDYAKSLINLNIDNFNTSKVTDMNYMFSNTKSLKSLNLKKFNTSNVISMSYIFSGSGLTSLDVSNFDTSKVKYMDSMFAGLNLNSLDLSNFNTGNVTNMSYMFSSVTLSNLDLRSFNTLKVTNMESMFSFTNINNLNLSNFNTSNVTDMSSMFSNYKNKTLDLSNFDFTNVTDVRTMFAEAKTTTVYVKDSTAASKINGSSNKPSTLNVIIK